MFYWQPQENCSGFVQLSRRQRICCKFNLSIVHILYHLHNDTIPLSETSEIRIIKMAPLDYWLQVWVAPISHHQGKLLKWVPSKKTHHTYSIPALPFIAALINYGVLDTTLRTPRECVCVCVCVCQSWRWSAKSAKRRTKKGGKPDPDPLHIEFDINAWIRVKMMARDDITITYRPTQRVSVASWIPCTLHAPDTCVHP